MSEETNLQGGQPEAQNEIVPSESAALPTPKRNKYADKMNKNKKKGRKGLKIGIGVIVLLLLVALGVFLVLRSRQSTDDTGTNDTAVVTRGMLETYIEGDGYTAAKKREELGKDLKGKVTEVAVEVGAEVKKNQKLLTVNPTETRKELTTAQEELTTAQRGVTDAMAEVNKAQNTVNAAQKKLNKLVITAPFTGKIVPVSEIEGGGGDPESTATSKTFRVGQQISEGQTIGYMVDDGSMRLALYFSTAYSKDIKSGQAATVSIPSAMSEVAGTVSTIEQVQKISPEGVSMFRVIISMKNPGSLTKGMLATATVKTDAGELFPAESGTLEYNREEAITSQVSGEISSVSGLDYYKYSSGATIMRVTSDSAQDELKSAQSGVVTAQNAVVNAQKLVQTKQERIAELNKLIANSTIKSPMDGVVVSLSAAVGDEVTGAGPICVVADMKDIVVNANITATDVSNVQPGQFATVTMYANDGEVSLTGTVKSVSLEASKDQQSNGQGSMPTFPAVITLDPMEGQTMRPDYPVNYKITTAQAMDSLMVPSSAIVNTEGGTAVFAKPAEGQSFENAQPLPEGTEGVPPDFVLVPVEVGIADSANTEILWGIEEGTTVYLAGPKDAYENMDGATGGVITVG